MYYTKHVTLTDNTLTEILSIPAGYVIHIVYIFIANHGTAANNLDLKFINSSGVDQLFFFDNTSISGGAKETLGGQSEAPIFVLHNGEVVKAQASQTTGNMEIAITFKLVEQAPALVNFNGS